MNSYIYCFIREDISPEQKIVQLGHACHEAGKLLPANEFKEPSTMILLSARDEADLKSNKLSVMSPIGRALIGKAEGDVVTVKTPKGDVEYEIDRIEHL